MLKSEKVAAIILAGGEGTRLKPLTEIRCKPAIAFGGRYRIIDVSISNALNAGFKNIYVLSQFLASSLNNYLLETYSSESLYGARLQVLTPHESFDNRKVWYEGTADAVRKNLSLLLDQPFQYFVILSGDQLYSMDLAHMVEIAEQKQADLLVASIPVHQREARRMGVMQIDSNMKITDFFEKPNDPEILSEFALTSTTYLGSMGIYVFKRDSLINLLREDPREDFGKHLIPSQLKKGNAYTYIFDGYWEDIGTIASYYSANIRLTKNSSCLDLYNHMHPIHTQASTLPAARLVNTTVLESIICEGSVILAASISGSMIGPKTYIDENSIIQNSIVIGGVLKSNRPPTHIGKNCKLDKVILDEGVHLEDNVTLTNTNNLQSYDSRELAVSEGIIVVKAGIRLPDGFAF